MRAQLVYYLPENWSASYRFTVFEGSYVILGESTLHDAAPEFRLARPVSGWAQPSAAAPDSMPEFELVWPVSLDRPLLDAAARACRQAQSRAKRKTHELPTSASSEMHMKLRRLSM